MESEQNVKGTGPLSKYANIEYRCNPPPAKRKLTNTVNPFDTVGNYYEKRLRDKLQKRNNGEIFNIYNEADISPCNTSVASSMADSAQDHRWKLIEDVYSRTFNDPYTRDSGAAIYKRSSKSLSDPDFSLPSRHSCTSRNTAISSRNRQVGYNNYDQDKHDTFIRSFFNNKPDEIAEYRSSHQHVTHPNLLQNMYNEEFVLKTIQRQARLQKLVKKLIIERQKEKQREAWNNYINELKNKHRYYSNEPTRISPQYVPNEEFTDDHWCTRLQPPDTCSNMYNNLDGRCTTDSPYKFISMPCSRSRHNYENNPYCYPTSAEGRFMMLNKDRQSFNSMLRPFNRYKPIEIERDLNKRRYHNNNMRCRKTFSNVQTDLKYFITQGVVTEGTDKECKKIDEFRKILHKRVSTGMATLKEQILQTENKMENPLENIEQKLDSLIKSVNSAILEIREQKDLNVRKCTLAKSRSISCTLNEFSDLVLNNNKINIRTKSESCGFQTNNDILYTTILQNNITNVILSEISTSTPQLEVTNDNKIARIIEEEMEKSEKMRKDIEELLHPKCKAQCSVEIEFDIPTRERTTLEPNLPQINYCTKDRNKTNTVIRSRSTEQENKQITMAVNTDPLGLCALLQVSAETIKQLLSYMLNLTYESDIPILQQRRRSCSDHFMCNICGETFNRPSQLSDHVENHYFKRRRNCCAYRQLLNLRNDHIGLFTCKYCGQRFIRFYCCEIHQQRCATSFGRKHDVLSNLMFLR